MAKSQYTDSITGNVIADLRYKNNKLIDYGNNTRFSPRFHTQAINSNNVNFTSDTKFSDKTHIFKYILNNSTFDITTAWLLKKSLSTTYTISFWLKTSNPISISQGYYYYFLFLNNIGGSSLTTNFGIQYINSGPILTTSAYNNPGSSSGWINTGQIAISNLNTWDHYAFVRNGTTFNVYRNGTKLFSNNVAINIQWAQVDIYFFSQGRNFPTSNNTFTAQFDDLVIIDGQTLWTSNFTPPNYFLTGDHDIPNRIRSKMIMWPRTSDYNDYFDKAYLY